MISICACSENSLLRQMVYTRDAKEFAEAEKLITLFGKRYYKTSWNSKDNTITYRV